MTETDPTRLSHESFETIELFVKIDYTQTGARIRQSMKTGVDSQEDLKHLGKIVKIIRDLDSSGKLNSAGVKLDSEFGLIKLNLIKTRDDL
jgi:hypothetical protein